MEIRKSIETNFLTCKLCHLPYKQPKALVCLHSFCQSCLEDIISKRKADEEAKEIETIKLLYKSSNSIDHSSGYRRKWSSRFRYGDYSNSLYGSSRFNRTVTTKDDVITCPICQKDTVVPTGGVTSLPADQLADKLASMVDRMPNFPVCDVCTKEPLLTDNHLNPMKSPQSNMSVQFKRSQYAGFNKYVSNDDTLSEYDSDADEGVSLDKLSIQDSMDNSETLSRHTSRSSNHVYKERDDKRLRKSLTSSRQRNYSSGPRPAISACLECGKRLCAYCHEAHSRMPVTTNHVLIQVDQMEQLRCNRHPRELRRFFCLTCRAYICIICAFETVTDNSLQSKENIMYTGHADHDILSMRQAVAAYQDQLTLKCTETQSHMNQIEIFLTGLQICENEMRRLRTQIEDTAMVFIDRIHVQRAKLCEQIDKMLGVELDQITNECNRLTSATSAWHNFINDDCVTSRLDLMDPIEALTEAGPMLDKLNRCLQLASSSILTCPNWQLFLSQLAIAENAVQNTDNILTQKERSNDSNNSRISGDCSNNEKNDTKEQTVEDPRIKFWHSRIGSFHLGEVNLGRIVTPSQLAAESKAKAAQFVSTHIQTGPELIKTLPPPKGALLHRANSSRFS
ncbi:E3 ubiquitin ligase TRIM56 [Schistosoma japonicum]|uniref:E3 ubiquitin ligase TRIM56 n=1 Tax=Schistosoma japonicum TaxID=6182 RepID=A0A4Z2CU04_SCHJA|nr:E3 ubiquitin ligase TRIM56 [Schistosoma japonicum]